MVKNKKIPRVFHTWDKWECYPAGLYENQKDGMTKNECETLYAEFLSSEERFSSALERVLTEWPNSCEHYLSNENMNRIAWLGQAGACVAHGLPSCYRGGYFKLTKEQQRSADLVALKYLNKWLQLRGFELVDLEGAGVNTQANIY
jgi:hypothetical protein